VDAFWTTAAGILETAQAAADPANLTILIGPQGSIHMVADSDWGLDALRQHHGARAAYRVSRNSRSVLVEGREGARTCRLETGNPVRQLLGGFTTIPHPAGTWRTLPAASD